MNETNQTDRFAPLFAELDRRLAGEVPVRLAIEGGSASGKTTLGKILAERYDCTVFHMDDFFLRAEQRTAARFAEPGGNVDRERFLAEVLLPLRRGEKVFYRRFDCASMQLQNAVETAPKKLVVAEGHTPCTPTLRRITIFLYFWTSPRNCSASAFPAATRRRKQNAFLPNGSRWSKRISPRSIFRQSARCAFPYRKERRGTCNLIILDCAAGKDRTGVVSAILLHKSGMSREYIIADLMKTASNPEAYLAQFAGEHPGIRLDVITPHERFMEKFLAWLSTQEI